MELDADSEAAAGLAMARLLQRTDGVDLAAARQAADAAPDDVAAQTLVADLDLDQRRDWLELFPFLLTRRPDSYGTLTAPVDEARPYGAGHAATAVIK